jgi:protein SCO1/2
MAKRILIATAIFLGVAVILVAYWPGLWIRPAVVPKAAIELGGAFTLTDTNGATVTEAALKGHYSLVYFGFTQCPDVCPLALTKITEAMQILGPEAEAVLPVFITVDPEHDTPEVMKSYLANFHPHFLGLTGSPDAVKQAETAYRVYAAKKAEANVVHSDVIFLMGPDGSYVAQFASDATSSAIANGVRRAMKAV